MIRKCAEKLERLINPISKGFAIFGAVALLLIMFLTVIDVIGRYLFSKPVIGAYECVEYGLIVTVFCGMAITQIKKQHVNVSIITDQLKGRKLYCLECITYLSSLVIIVLFLWGGMKQFSNIFQVKQVSNILMIPQWPFQLILVLGVFLFCLTLFVDFLKSIASLLDGKVEAPSDDKGINPPPAF